MNLKSVKEVIARGVGDTTTSIIGTVSGVWSPKIGGEGKKAWKRQMVLLKEGDETIALILWNHEEIKESAKGEKLSVTSETGMAIKDYDGKMQLEVPKSAEVSLVRGQGSAPAPTQQNLPIRQPGANTAPPDVAGVKKRVGKMANALILGVDAACYVADHAGSRGVQFGPEQIQSIAVHIAIGLERLGWVDSLPHGAMDKPKPKPAPAPIPEPEPDNGPSFESMCPPDDEGPF